MKCNTQNTQNTQGVKGNTKTLTPGTKQSTTVSNPSSKSRKWCLTLNNYTDKEYTDTHKYLVSKKWKWIIGKEIGDKKETPHLQMYIEGKNAILFKTIKKAFPRAHIEQAKGSLRQNYDYCSKENNFITNIDFRSKEEKWMDDLKQKILDEEYPEVKFKPWQKEVIDILDKKPHPRHIHWYYEKTGNVGKSWLCKYIALKYNVIICSGKKADIFNQVKACLDKMIEPRIILLDIPRTSQDYINYTAIEELKNGMIYSGKYEGGQCLFRRPHIIAFSNSKPDTSACSADRWIIKEI